MSQTGQEWLQQRYLFAVSHRNKQGKPKVRLSGWAQAMANSSGIELSECYEENSCSLQTPAFFASVPLDAAHPAPVNGLRSETESTRPAVS